MKKTHIIYLHETFRESITRDIGTALTFVALAAFGYFIESASLEWAGIFIAGYITLSSTLSTLKGESKMTPGQAREWLDKNFPTEKGE